MGGSSKRWDDVFATNGTIQTSDKRQKNQISGSDLGLSFINSLNPIKYQYKSGSRTHYGLIAQEVSSSVSKDFAGYIEPHFYTSQSYSEPLTHKEFLQNRNLTGNWDDWEFSHTGSLGLRYNEFISPMIKAIQELTQAHNNLIAQITGSTDLNQLKASVTASLIR